MKPFNFNDGSREQIRRDAQARARFHRWQAPGRSLIYGRGGTQLLLDVCNPEVQDFVFKVVDDLMTAKSLIEVKCKRKDNVMN